MKEGEVKQVSNRLLEIINHAKDATFVPGKRYRHFGRQEGGFSLSGDYVDNYERLLAHLLEHHNWQEKYSEKHLSSLLQDIIIQAFDTEKSDEIKKMIEEMADTHREYTLKHRAFVPLSGIQLAMRSLKIGNVTLRTFSDNLLRIEIAKLRNIINTTPYSKEAQTQFLTERVGQLQQLRGKVVAQYTVIAEPKRASERAEEETIRVLDLLRFAIPALYNDNLNISLGLEGEIVNNISRIVPVSSIEIQSFHLYYSRTGSWANFEINQESVKKMRGIGVFFVSEILKKPASQVSQFESIILQGLHWFSVAMTQRENSNKLLNLITVLETFLTPRDNNPIGTAIAEGVAIIRGGSLKSRRDTKSIIKDFYKKRSGLSHGGKKAILDQEVLHLRHIVAGVIMWMIKNRSKFTSQKDVLGWIEDKKLS